MARSIEEIIKAYGMVKLEGEGGYIKFIEEFGQGAGMIYYLMSEDEFSHLHKLSEDEAWFFLEGDSAEQLTLSSEGIIESTVLNENNRHSLVKKGYYQTTFIKEIKLGYALFSTIMSPRYKSEMYEHGSFEIGEKYPILKPYICEALK